VKDRRRKQREWSRYDERLHWAARVGEMSKKLIHCKVVCELTFMSKPLKSNKPAYRDQIFLIYKCPTCKTELFRWYGIAIDETTSPLTRISTQSFRLEWSQRLTSEALKKPIKDTRAKCHTGEFTMKASRDPAQIMDYMKQVEAMA
jgi:hypothetical protein